jgi:hypothetical protein
MPHRPGPLALPGLRADRRRRRLERRLGRGGGRRRGPGPVKPRSSAGLRPATAVRRRRPASGCSSSTPTASRTRRPSSGSPQPDRPARSRRGRLGSYDDAPAAPGLVAQYEEPRQPLDAPRGGRRRRHLLDGLWRHPPHDLRGARWLRRRPLSATEHRGRRARLPPPGRGPPHRARARGPGEAPQGVDLHGLVRSDVRERALPWVDLGDRVRRPGRAGSTSTAAAGCAGSPRWR